MHYYMSSQIQRRAEDGIHWNSDGVRYQTIVFLTHFCLSRQIGKFSYIIRKICGIRTDIGAFALIELIVDRGKIVQ